MKAYYYALGARIRLFVSVSRLVLACASRVVRARPHSPSAFFVRFVDPFVGGPSCYAGRAGGDRVRHPRRVQPAGRGAAFLRAV
eukprot:3216139-Pyramimonas_sp.AAC.1